MNKLESDIISAQSKIKNNCCNSKNNSIYDIFSSIYPFSTENIKAYYNKFNLHNKDILTIGSSGDHSINLELENAKSIDFFDINPYTRYYYELKKAAIKTLSYEEFLKFFCYENYPIMYEKNEKVFNKSLYSKIALNLIEDSKIFWDSLYSNNSGYDIRTSSLFSKDEEPLKVIKKTNPYLDEDNYEILKNKQWHNSFFYQTNLIDLDKKIQKKYDIIMLSNIAQYIENIFDKNHLENLKNIILKLDEKLNDDGIVLVSYLYNIYSNSEFNKKTPIYNIQNVCKIIDGLEIIDFEGMQNLKYSAFNNIKDGILVYKKTK